MARPTQGSGKTGTESEPKTKLRLDAYLAHAGLGSRREARALVRRGLISVDGEVCRDAGRRIGEEPVMHGDTVLMSPEAHRDYVLHKPVGFACSHDTREAPLVDDLLDETLRRRSLRIAGRLDRATSGLLILTTDGDFNHRLTHPRRKLPKQYRIVYDGDLSPDAVALCEAGLEISGESRPLLPAELVLEEPGTATLTIREGRTHQVRRMIRALGGEVVQLHRDRIGSLTLPPDLEEGDFRPLTPPERALLLSESSL